MAGATSHYRRYHYVLAPETSSEDSGTDSTESVYSMQDKETEYVRDESDTCTKSDASEYTLNSLPSEENLFVESLSSASDDFIIRTEKIVVETRAMSESLSGEAEVESVAASSDDSELGQADYWNCAQCHKSNNHPKYRYCMKCFRLRKEMYPPKPKATKKRLSGGGTDKSLLERRKKRKHSSEEREAKVMKLDSTMDLGALIGKMSGNAETYASLCEEVEQIQAAKRVKESDESNVNTNSLTCRSLVGRFGTLNTSSQTYSALCERLDKVYEANAISVEGKAAAGNEISTPVTTKEEAKINRLDSTMDLGALMGNAEQRNQASKRTMESDASNQTLSNVNTNSLTCRSLIGRFDTLNTSSQTYSALCEQLDKVYEANATSVEANEIAASVTKDEEVTKTDLSSTSALCIMCDRAPKNGVFVHMNVAHACCCYLCALKVWKQTKKCPTCNLPASKVIKLIVS